MSGRKRKPTGLAGAGNDGYIAAMRGLRGSSAASKHQDRRTRRARSRQAADRSAISRSNDDEA